MELETKLLLLLLLGDPSPWWRWCWKWWWTMSGEEEGEEDSANAAEDSEVAWISHLPRSGAAATRDFVEEELACWFLSGGRDLEGGLLLSGEGTW